MDATIEDVEAILVARTRGLLKKSDLSADPDADASPRAYLADPIAYAIRKSGGTTARVRVPTAADLVTVGDDLTDQFLDIAELRAIDSGLGNWTVTDETEGPLSQKWAALAKIYMDRAECLRAKIKDVYKVDAEAPTVANDGLGGFSGGFSGGGTSTLVYF